MPTGAINYVVKGETFVDEAYAAKNFTSAKIRAMGDRRTRGNRSEILIGNAALGDFQLAYGACRDYKWSAPKPSIPIIPEPGLPIAEKETKPKGAWPKANGGFTIQISCRNAEIQNLGRSILADTGGMRRPPPTRRGHSFVIAGVSEYRQVISLRR